MVSEHSPKQLKKGNVLKSAGAPSGVQGRDREGHKSGVFEHGIWFLTKDVANRWDYTLGKNIVYERILYEDKYQISEEHQLVKKTGLMSTLVKTQPYNEQLVREIIGNIHICFGTIGGLVYRNLLVRGKIVRITPDFINA